MLRLYSFIFLLFSSVFVFSQAIEETVTHRLAAYFHSYIAQVDVAQAKLDTVIIMHDEKQIEVEVSTNFSYQPFRTEQVKEIYKQVENLLPGPVRFYKLVIRTDGKKLEELIPNFYLTQKQMNKTKLAARTYSGKPWVFNNSKPFKVTKGLHNKHLVVWQSHGRYYKNDSDKWVWQRPRLHCVTEDLFTQSFVVPYLIPMLENAGACVFTPRERDTQCNEVIVDDSNIQGYIEENKPRRRWGNAGYGFSLERCILQDNQNPFKMGSARSIKTTKKRHVWAAYIPQIPEAGRYAVYVSYTTLPTSVDDAHYSVKHKGGITEFSVNQQMGGGTWVYLGTFEFDKGVNQNGMVLISSESKSKGVITTDAVRFGGGMGNISRGDKVSGLPRFLEGARYTAQWYGMPYAVYSTRQGTNDYADDINARSHTLNYLSGGSIFNPDTIGKHVPFEASIAIHSDAGYKVDDAKVGTLGIFTTKFADGKLADGSDRYTSRDLADLLMTQMKNDIQTEFGMEWNRRGLWNRNYSETRLPSCPSTIIELLSHQNFADMKCGHDPNFKFTVGRALYKGILKFVANRHGKSYVVQPLPVSHFAVQFGKKENTLLLSWLPRADKTEPSAEAEKYCVYTRMGNGGFDNGVIVDKTSLVKEIIPGELYSFKVTAINEGGESFPSEILTAYKSLQEHKRILLVNGFDRVCGPAIVDQEDRKGFVLDKDYGVSYVSNSSYCGYQTGFDTKYIGKETANGLGVSGCELEGMTVAGNTFDYPFIHGQAIQDARHYSFASCSDEALEQAMVPAIDYDMIDYIAGLEKDSPVNSYFYKTFTSQMQRLLTAYCRSGGSVMVSGAYVGSDMSQTQGNKNFTERILKYRFEKSMPSSWNGKIFGLNKTFDIFNYPNKEMIFVNTPDCLQPVDEAFTPFVYQQERYGAAVAYKGDQYRTFILGFPFECIQSANDRNFMMKSILYFLLK